MTPPEFIANTAFAAAMATMGRRARNRLIALARNPEAAQTRALKSVLRLCVGTERGARLGLARIGSVADFRAHVPIVDYEELRPGIERQIAAGAPVVAPEPPIMYARSSGTTGAPKYIPVTPTTLSHMRNAQRALAFAQHEALGAFDGRILGLGGARCEETFPSGAVAGAATGLIYETMPRFLRAKYVIPPAVFGIDDYETKYAIAARLALQDPDVTSLACANPSTILRLLGIIRRDLAAFADEIETGEARALLTLGSDRAAPIASAMRAGPERARALRALLRCGTAPSLVDLWPRLRAITTWLRAGCAPAAEAVRSEAPGVALVDAGYVASELRGTVVVDIARGLALPLLGDVFFEFVPATDWDDGKRDTLLLHELEEGRDYHVLVTTPAGLLRYHMNDVLRAGPQIENTVSLAFVRKGRGCANITGEKLTEDQIHLAMADICPPANGRAPFYIVLADARASGYRAFVEGVDASSAEIEEALDRLLSALNLEYAAKRSSGRLHPIRVTQLAAGAGEAYYRYSIDKRKQREAQFKFLALQNAEDCDFDFAAFASAHAVSAVQDR